MKTRLSHGLSVVVLSTLCMLISSFTAFAANISGGLDSVTNSVISGWAIDKDNPDQNAEVVLYLYSDGSTEAKELAKVKADQYRSDLTKTLGSGNHSFSYPVNWSELKGTVFTVEAYVTSDKGPVRIGTSLQYTKDSTVTSSAKQATGPAHTEVASAVSTEPKNSYLGKFVTTAYCSCDKCSSGQNRTYAGTTPRANHTISADISLYPIGKKLKIGDTIYTVEDIGSDVNGSRLDIFFDTHQQALNYGSKVTDVYSVN